jgi:hypothetical protein
MKTARERFALILEALPDGGVPAVVRLRRFLKAALRGYALRCVSVVEVAREKPADVESAPRGGTSG